MKRPLPQHLPHIQESEVDNSTEKALPQREDMYLDLLENANDLIQSVNPDGRFLYVNRVWRETLGYTQKEISGLSLFDIIHPDSRAHCMEVFQRAISGGSVDRVEAAFVTKDGKKVIVEGSANCKFEDGKPVATRGIFRIITERKRVEEVLLESEEKYRNLFEEANDAIFLADTETGYISDANREAERLLGRPVKEIIGMHQSELHPPGRADYYEDKFRKHVEAGHITDYEAEVIREDGTIVPVYISAGVVQLDGRRLIQGIFRDITEQKRTETQLLAYQKELRSLASQLSLAEERERRRIATEVHDRVSQTLALCRMKLGALVESAPSTDFAENLGEIHALIKQLIEEIGSLTFELSSPLLYELGLEAAVERLTEQIEEQYGVLLNFEDDGQPKPLDDDIRVLLFQTVRELLVNVTKHAQAHHGRVCLKRHDGNLHITVEDDGVGFDTSGISSGRRRAKGFGLFSIRERLHYIGGDIEVESEHGRGTRVTLVAPLKQNDWNQRAKVI